jgi:hypothetical protein
MERLAPGPNGIRSPSPQHEFGFFEQPMQQSGLEGAGPTYFAIKFETSKQSSGRTKNQTEQLKASPRIIIAHAARAFLFANATTALLIPRRSFNADSQESSLSILLFDENSTARAP